LERGNDPNNVHPDPSPPTQPKYESDPQLRKRIRAILVEERSKKRQEGIWPYLLIRAFPGDYGVRLPPLNMFWESPDIQVVKGIVSTLEGNTPTLHPCSKCTSYHLYKSMEPRTSSCYWSKVASLLGKSFILV
jgi:hypothetical protein